MRADCRSRRRATATHTVARLAHTSSPSAEGPASAPPPAPGLDTAVKLAVELRRERVDTARWPPTAGMALAVEPLRSRRVDEDFEAAWSGGKPAPAPTPAPAPAPAPPELAPELAPEPAPGLSVSTSTASSAAARTSLWWPPPPPALEPLSVAKVTLGFRGSVWPGRLIADSAAAARAPSTRCTSDASPVSHATDTGAVASTTCCRSSPRWAKERRHDTWAWACGMGTGSSPSTDGSVTPSSTSASPPSAPLAAGWCAVQRPSRPPSHHSTGSARSRPAWSPLRKGRPCSASHTRGCRSTDDRTDGTSRPQDEVWCKNSLSSSRTDAHSWMRSRRSSTGVDAEGVASEPSERADRPAPEGSLRLLRGCGSSSPSPVSTCRCSPAASKPSVASPVLPAGGTAESIVASRPRCSLMRSCRARRSTCCTKPKDGADTTVASVTGDTPLRQCSIMDTSDAFNMGSTNDAADCSDDGGMLPLVAVSATMPSTWASSPHRCAPRSAMQSTAWRAGVAPGGRPRPMGDRSSSLNAWYNPAHASARWIFDST